MTDLRRDLIRSLASEGLGPRAVAYDPDARAFEAFAFGWAPDLGMKDTKLLNPLEAVTLQDALAEVTSRWGWDRGARLGVREIGDSIDLLHVYAVRRKARGQKAWQDHIPATEYERWLDHICTINLDVLHGIARGAVGNEIVLHERRQQQRPEGARR